MAPWAETAFFILSLITLGALAAWGVALQRMTVRLERAHPAAFAALRARSRRKAARLAVVSELQGALARAEVLPEGAGDDPSVIALASVERSARRALIVLSLALFALFALG